MVAWGLGNLVFDCDCTTEEDGLLVRLEIDDHRVTRASVAQVHAGLAGQTARQVDTPILWQMLEGLGSTPLSRRGALADF